MSISAPIAPEAAPPVITRRGGIAGKIALGFWILFGLGLVYYLVSAYNPELIARYGPLYLKGLWTTLSLVVLSFVFGALVSIPVAFGRMAKTAQYQASRKNHHRPTLSKAPRNWPKP